MPIRVECPNPKCKKALQAPDTHAGKKARCPGCGYIITIPDPDTVLVEASADPLIGSKLGHIEIKEKLGQGGMGAVYLGVNTSLDRMVAVKVLPQDLVKDNPAFLDRFLREAKMAAKLNHPNAVTVYSIGEEQGRRYIEMEYVQGMNLRQVIAKQGKVELKEASRIIKDAAGALAAAHEKGIVHRDIKPDNIMLTEKGEVKVADFGLARVSTADSSITMSGQVMGTPLYMSPEQGQGKPTDGRTDIYSLGATYYHALVGLPPFTADTPLQVMMKHATEPVSWPEGREDILPDIRVIIEKMMAKGVEDRYQNCEEVIHAIEEYFKPKAVVAKAVRVGGPVQQTAAIATPPKNAYVVSAEDLAAIESATRAPRHPTPLQTAAVNAIPVGGRRGIPRWVLAAAGLGVLAVVLAMAGIVMKSKGNVQTRKATTDVTASEAKQSQKTDDEIATAPVGPRDDTKDSHDDVYVTQAATGDPIPHPLSRKTTPLVVDGKTIEVPVHMSHVPAGPFMMGDDSDPSASPAHEVDLKAFFIDMYEVTNAQYMEFVKATGHAPPFYIAMNRGRIPAGRENHPVTHVSWEDAKAYCDWCGKRLPTEAEWEKAAGWDSQRRQMNKYPWGDKVYDDKGQLLGNGAALWGWMPGTDYGKWYEEFKASEKGKEQMALGGATMAVGTFKGGRSPGGCYDMGGNVWEWVEDWFDRYPGNRRMFPEGVKDCGKTHRVLRGGAWNGDSPHTFRCAKRERALPTDQLGHHGFRCAADCPWKPNEPSAVGEQRPETSRESQGGEGYIALLNGKDLAGWRPRDTNKPSGWTVQDGVLVNTEGGADLISEEQFADFLFHCEFKIPAGGNSGVFLRGRYEVQIFDDSGQAPTTNTSGGIWGLIAPSENASKPAGEWQTLDAGIRGKHVQVALNGKTVIQYGELTKPTNGALDQNADQPGPIMLQGRFSRVEFRDIRIKPLAAASASATPSGADNAFIKEVAALPPEEQVKRVVAKLKEINPGYDGNEKHTIEGGKVVELTIESTALADLSPIRALTQLRTLKCGGYRLPDGKQVRNSVSDLSPLRGLPLESLDCSNTSVKDYSPLEGMPMKKLTCFATGLKDLSPFKNAPLTHLACSGNRDLVDLSPLQGKQMDYLNIENTGIADLAPMAGMRIKRFDCRRTKVTDFSPLKDTGVRSLFCDFDPKRDTEVLRSIKMLEDINGLPAEEFWKKVEAEKVP